MQSKFFRHVVLILEGVIRKCFPARERICVFRDQNATFVVEKASDCRQRALETKQ